MAEIVLTIEKIVFDLNGGIKEVWVHEYHPDEEWGRGVIITPVLVECSNCHCLVDLDSTTEPFPNKESYLCLQCFEDV